MPTDIAAQATAAYESTSGGAPAGGAASPPPAAPPPAPSSAGNAAPPSGAQAYGQTAAAPGQAAGAAAPLPAESEWQGIRDAARAYGYNFDPSIADDNQALVHLIQQAQQVAQLQEMARYGQSIYPYHSQFQAWMQQQQQQQQAAQQQAADWLRAPPWDANWRSQITRDPQTGELRPVQGADPMVVNKYLAGLAHQQSFLERFAFDPIGSIQQGLAPVIQQIAGQMIQQQLGGYRDQSFATNFIRENSSWLHQQDQSGNVVRDPRGQPVLSQWGTAFRNYVQEAMQMGIQDETARANYALRCVRSDYMLWAQQQGSTTQQGDAAKAQFLQQAAQAQAAHLPAAVPQPAVQGGTNGGGRPGPGRRPPKVDLAQRMRQNLAAAGLSPQDFTARPPGR